MDESYYALLGVSPDATTADIERAYRQRLKETHPDVSDDEDAGERTKRLIEAKETLTDEAERARYDRLGHAAYVEGSTPETGGVDTQSDPSQSTGATSRSGASASGSGGATAHSTAGADPTESPGSRAWGDGATSTARTGQREATAADHGGAASTGGEGTADGRGRQHGRTDQWSTTTTEEGVEGNSWRAWDTEGSYAVRRGDDSIPGSGILSTQQSLLVFATTLVVYPVLLFGALHGTFPLVVNVAVAMCAVLVVAFLQSVPLAAVGVFGFWTLFVPPLLLFRLDVGLLTPVGVLAIAGVAFPFGLSVLTWRFAGPGRVG